MATININLLPEEMRPSKSDGGFSGGSMPSLDRSQMVPIGIGLLAAVALSVVPSLARSFWLEPWAASVAEEDAAVQQDIDKYNLTLNDLKTQADNKELLRKQLNTLQNVAGVTASWGVILDELRQITPGNLWFDSFRADSAASVITISGNALDYGSVAYFHRNLERSEYFSDPVLGNTTMSNGPVPTVRFDMTVTVRMTGNEKLK
jgi:Tfp pilus assembly protein PilN